MPTSGGPIRPPPPFVRVSDNPPAFGCRRGHVASGRAQRAATQWVAGSRIFGFAPVLRGTHGVRPLCTLRPCRRPFRQSDANWSTQRHFSGAIDGTARSSL